MDPTRPFRPEVHAAWDAARMGKTTLFQSERLLVGLNAFEPGQEHRPHAHPGQDKLYVVLAGRGRFTVGDVESSAEAGAALVVPAGVPHGIRNTGAERLLVLAVLAPAPA